MIRFEIEGQYLDLKDDLSLTFKKSNILFAFDKIECERSASFSIPATPNNNKIFGLAKWVQTYGAGMRRRYDAQMQGSMVTKSGYLYVSEYNAGAYSAIFVTGELLGLRRIKEAGNIRDIICPTETTIYGDMYDAGASVNVFWQGVKYLQARTNHPTKYPSMQLKEIIERCCNELGVNVTLPSGAESFRLIPKSLSPYEKTGVLFRSVIKAPSSALDSANTIEGWYNVFEPCLIPIYDIYGTVEYFDDPDTHQHGYGFYYNALGTPVCYVQGWRARIKANINLGPDALIKLGTLYRTNGDVTIAAGSDASSVVLNNVCIINELGIKNPYWDNTGHAKSFEVAAGDEFCFIDYNDVEILKTNPTAAEEHQTFKVVQFAHNGARYDTQGQPSYSFYAQGVGTGWHDVTDEGDYEPYEIGDSVDVFSSLPECTLIELLKAVAYMTGTAINYSDGVGITFDALDFDTWTTKSVENVQDIGNLKRTVGEYAQSNLIRFESDKTMYELEKIVLAYRIENDNIEQEKELAKIFASEGSIYYQDKDTPTDYLYMRNESADIGTETLAAAYTGETNLKRVGLPENENLKSLLDESTGVQIRMRMTLVEFEQMSPKTVLYYEGVRYAWLEAQWSKGTATIKLAKIRA